MHFEKYFIFGNETLFIFIYQQPKKIKGFRPVAQKKSRPGQDLYFIQTKTQSHLETFMLLLGALVKCYTEVLSQLLKFFY